MIAVSVPIPIVAVAVVVAVSIMFTPALFASFFELPAAIHCLCTAVAVLANFFAKVILRFTDALVATVPRLGRDTAGEHNKGR
jgi:hypothetical protein